jgi:hypothetical protein
MECLAQDPPKKGDGNDFDFVLGDKFKAFQTRAMPISQTDLNIQASEH